MYRTIFFNIIEVRNLYRLKCFKEEESRTMQAVDEVSIRIHVSLEGCHPRWQRDECLYFSRKSTEEVGRGGVSLLYIGHESQDLSIAKCVCPSFGGQKNELRSVLLSLSSRHDLIYRVASSLMHCTCEATYQIAHARPSAASGMLIAASGAMAGRGRT